MRPVPSCLSLPKYFQILSIKKSPAPKNSWPPYCDPNRTFIYNTATSKRAMDISMLTDVDPTPAYTIPVPFWEVSGGDAVGFGATTGGGLSVVALGRDVMVVVGPN